MNEKWQHTGKLRLQVPKFNHEAKPYARIGDDNRCEYCGDIIERFKEIKS